MAKVGFSVTYHGNEMSRRIIDLTTPGGKIKNSTIEQYMNLKSKIGEEWEYLTNNTASDFLNIKGWPYNKKSFVRVDVGTVELDKNLVEIELSRYGQCYTLKNAPVINSEGSGHGMKFMINAMHSAYPLSEFRVGDIIQGTKSGVRVRVGIRADPRTRIRVRVFMRFFATFKISLTRIRVIRAVRVVRARIRADIFWHDYQFTLDIFSNFLFIVDQNSNFIAKFYEYQ